MDSEQTSLLAQPVEPITSGGNALPTRQASPFAVFPSMFLITLVFGMFGIVQSQWFLIYLCSRFVQPGATTLITGKLLFTV